MKRIINGEEFSRIGYFGISKFDGELVKFETWYPTANLPYLSGRACFWLL